MRRSTRQRARITERRSPRAVAFVALLCATGAGPSADEATTLAGSEFTECLAGLETRARAAGISDAVIRDVLRRLEPVERVIELDRKQPEFTQTFGRYYARRVTPERIQRGRELLDKHRDVLNAVVREYRVPAHYLLAFWGLETNFGGYFGDFAVPDSLATLACDPRRSEFFAAELLAALAIIDDGDVAPEHMVGSWAGAMGHMQFLPSVFRQHAVDADGDGRRDVWQSVPDALASAARYLRAAGWQPGLRWGREILLPDGFDFTLAGRDRTRPLAEWIALGVAAANAEPLPRVDLPAAVVVPSGHAGPAFLVYANFDVILRWNRSEYYALAVGRLADRIAGAGPLVNAPDTETPPLSRDDVRRLQAGLGLLGYEVGEPDGIFGSRTQRGLSRFQQSLGLVADGHPDAEALALVRAAADDEGGE